MRHVALFAMCVGVLALGFALPVHAQGRVVDRYEIKPPTQDQLRKAREWMIALGKQAQQAAPKLHRGETAYFYLFSAFENKADDKRYSDTAEKMFKELCTQFKVNPKSVWIGKCPIFAFNDAKQYATFCAGLGFTGDIEKSGGLTLFRSDGLVCIALNDTKTQTQFYDTMVHEGTHAFMARFLTTRFLPVWVNEGIAEHMCARIIEDSRAKTLWQEATKQVIDGERKPETIFDGVNLDAFDYGMAHALVRFMIEKDGTAFSQFIRRLKQGESEEAALKAAYKTDRAGLIRNWRAGAEESLKAAQREAEKKEALKETQKPDPQAKAAPSDKTEAKTTPPPKEPLKPIPPHPSPSSDDPLAIMPATEEQAQAAKEWAMDLGDRGKQAAPKMHLVETSNFYLYSTFENKAGDTLFRDTADRMFKELCKQFQVNPDEVWLDKCPILSFNDTKQFVAFCKTIDIDEERAEKTGGFAWWRSDGLVYIVLHNKWKNTAQFTTRWCTRERTRSWRAISRRARCRRGSTRDSPSTCAPRCSKTAGPRPCGRTRPSRCWRARRIPGRSSPTPGGSNRSITGWPTRWCGS